jgi:hypothetical protein
MAANRETESVTGLPFVTEAEDEKALGILKM